MNILHFAAACAVIMLLSLSSRSLTLHPGLLAVAAGVESRAP